jgi:hypothetical protein
MKPPKFAGTSPGTGSACVPACAAPAAPGCADSLGAGFCQAPARAPYTIPQLPEEI